MKEWIIPPTGVDLATCPYFILSPRGIGKLMRDPSQASRCTFFQSVRQNRAHLCQSSFASITSDLDIFHPRDPDPGGPCGSLSIQEVYSEDRGPLQRIPSPPQFQKMKTATAAHHTSSQASWECDLFLARWKHILQHYDPIEWSGLVHLPRTDGRRGGGWGSFWKTRYRPLRFAGILWAA